VAFREGLGSMQFVNSMPKIIQSSHSDFGATFNQVVLSKKKNYSGHGSLEVDKDMQVLWISQLSV
jgi:hypothetical protein